MVHDRLTPQERARLGLAMRARLEALSMTQGALASACGRTRAWVRNIFLGQPQRLRSYAVAFDTLGIQDSEIGPILSGATEEPERVDLDALRARAQEAWAGGDGRAEVGAWLRHQALHDTHDSITTLKKRLAAHFGRSTSWVHWIFQGDKRERAAYLDLAAVILQEIPPWMTGAEDRVATVIPLIRDRLLREEERERLGRWFQRTLEERRVTQEHLATRASRSRIWAAKVTRGQSKSLQDYLLALEAIDVSFDVIAPLLGQIPGLDTSSGDPGLEEVLQALTRLHERLSAIEARAARDHQELLDAITRRAMPTSKPGGRRRRRRKRRASAVARDTGVLVWRADGEAFYYQEDGSCEHAPELHPTHLPSKEGSDVEST